MFFKKTHRVLKTNIVNNRKLCKKHKVGREIRPPGRTSRTTRRTTTTTTTTTAATTTTATTTTATTTTPRRNGGVSPSRKRTSKCPGRRTR